MITQITKAELEYEAAYQRYRERCLNLISDTPDAYQQDLNAAKKAFAAALRDIPINDDLWQSLKRKNLLGGEVERLLRHEAARRQNLSIFAKFCSSIVNFFKSVITPSLKKRQATFLKAAAKLDMLVEPVITNVDFQDMRRKRAALKQLVQQQASFLPGFMQRCCKRCYNSIASFDPITSIKGSKDLRYDSRPV